MRDTTPLDPMWDPRSEDASPRAARLMAGAGRLLGAFAPSLVTWVRGMHPQVRLAWGSNEYHLRRDGVVSTRRAEPGFEDNPRSNYNERVRKRQEKAAARAPSEEAAPAPDARTEAVPDAPPSPPKLDLSEAALRRAVSSAMGHDEHAEALISEPAALKSELARVRASLQALDDVKDWGALEALDEELYKLHKAVEYKLRNHKASEAKSKLDDLFK